MNELGSKNIPFLFFIDFDMLQPLIFQLPLDTGSEIYYSFPGMQHLPQCASGAELHYFEKFPVSYQMYEKSFNNVLENIRKGNSYLVNLTFPTKISTNLSLKDIFSISQAKYKVLFKNDFVFFSPEPFVTIADGKISSFPMKGTIDAGIPDAENCILNDIKETAEHYTIVDLIRNDLSMVADSVTVEKLRYIDKLTTSGKTLLQVSSVITGHLEENYNQRIGNIIFSMLPAGSVSGAPKIKTVEIIHGSEIDNRGYYTGVCGIFDGKNLDSCVMIRFIENNNGQLIYRSGGGITSLSDCRMEYNELIDKIYVPAF